MINTLKISTDEKANTNEENQEAEEVVPEQGGRRGSTSTTKEKKGKEAGKGIKFIFLILIWICVTFQQFIVFNVLYNDWKLSKKFQSSCRWWFSPAQVQVKVNCEWCSK